LDGKSRPFVARELVESEKKNSEANAAEQAPPKNMHRRPSRDAKGKNEIEAATETAANLGEMDGRTQLLTQVQSDSSTEVGGQDSMRKRGRQSQEVGLGRLTAAVEQTKPATETASKAMAAAADSSVSANDARTIANIVDSVMADLRPRIVEEIARKLAGK
jgi:hypothetical protein